MPRYCRFIGILVLIGLLVATLAITIAQPKPKPAASEDGQVGRKINLQPSAESGPFMFVVFGDNQPSRPDGPQPSVFKTLLKEMGSFNPAFAVSTGDRIYGAGSLSLLKEQYREFEEVTQSLLKAPIYPAAGNHDIMGTRKYQEFFAQQLGLDTTYYSFDYANSHFIVLNTEVIGERSRITGDQLEWLEEDLKKSRSAHHKFVFFHQPLYPVDGHRGSSLDKYPKERDALHNLFVRNRITAVFSGHEHLFHTEVRNGVRYVISGGGGGFLYPSYKGKGDFHHFVVVSVDGNKVEMKVVRPAEADKQRQVSSIDEVGSSL